MFKMSGNNLKVTVSRIYMTSIDKYCSTRRTPSYSLCMALFVKLLAIF